MCFHSKLSKSAQELKTRFKTSFEQEINYSPNENINGFSHPNTPIITNKDPHKIQLFNWGLLPAWAKEVDFRKNTLNAKIETLQEKPSFKPYINNRCLVITDGFYEWQWLDEKGKQKQKYVITLPNNQLFCFAGIWNIWVDKQTGELINTYTIITTIANEQMAKIHNSKKRMPLILTPENEKNWLNKQEIKNNILQLNTTKIENKTNQII